jgi:beta-mannanase
MANVCQLGVYDGNGTFSASTTMSYDVYYVSWYPWTAGSLTALCNASWSKGRTPIVTVLPNINPKVTTAWKPGYSNLLDDVAAGEYDYAIEGIAADLRAYNWPVILRFAPWMDDISKADIRPWVTAAGNGDRYAAAYNRFTNVIKLYTHHLAQLKFMWSPDGKYFVASYFPIPLDPVKYPNNVMTAGNVDYIGFSLFEYPEYDLANSGFVWNFQQRYDALLQRFKLAQKPLIIEMGCGVGGYQTAWTQNALTQLQNYANNPPAYSSANLIAALWYNAPTTDTTWGFQLPAPDFSVDPGLWHL